MKHLTLSRQTAIILLICMLILFISGFAVMQSLQSSYLELLYGRTQILVKQALQQMENRINAAKQTAYDIIVSDTTQTSVSGYWDAVDSDAGRAASLSWTDGITNSIATYLKSNSEILCSNYIDADGSVKVIASRKYMKLSDEQAHHLSVLAIAEEGGTVVLSGKSIGLGDDTLLILKQLREKRRLSMRHTGVVVLFLNIKELGSGMTDAWEGMFLLERDSLSFVLGSGPQNAFSFEETNEGYSLKEHNGVQYFVLYIHGTLFSNCLAVLQYNPIFSTTKQLLIRHTLIYALSCTVILILALTFTNLATRDFAMLRKHLGTASDGQTGMIPIFSAKGHSRDADELYEAYNSMAGRINQLIHDNYEAQLAIKDAHLAALQAQINPHFLYNTLHSIYWAAKSGERNQAASMTQDLSLLLRDAVNTDESIVTIDRELEITCCYIRIQKQRYRERLNVEFDIDSDASALAIPKFTIQPLLENAIRYGIEPQLAGGVINISIIKDAERCVCKVMNDGPSPDADLSKRIREGNVIGHGTGIGLVNIDKRIRSMFGDECGVSVYRDEALGRTVTRVDFTAIPFEEIQEAQT